MNILNVKEILKGYNQGINNVVNLEETKDVLDILFFNKIIKMQKDGSLKKVDKNKVYVGKLQKKEGFGFVVVDDVSDFYVKNIDANLDGDEVLILLTEEVGRNLTAKIIGLVNRQNEYLVLKRNRNGGFDVLSKNVNSNVEVKGLDCEQIKPGTILSVHVNKVKKHRIVATLNNIIADENDPDLDMKMVLDKYSISVDFSEDVQIELGSIEDEISEDEIRGREDLRDQIFFTIDGDDSKDLDDAISLVREASGYRLYVSIADVSHYVLDGTRLDEEAQERATSVYFVDRVVPMLPKKISNGICSLHSGVDRLTVTCEVALDFDGSIREINVYESLINSKHRLTYKEVNKMLMENDRELIAKYADVYGILKEMNKLAKSLNKKRIARGAFNLEDTEAKFVLDDEQNIIDIVYYDRKDGEKLIEEFMILANESVTMLAENESSSFIYRVHGTPNATKLKGLKDLLLHFNIKNNLDPNNLDPHDFKEILDSVDEDIIKRTISKAIVRSMQKAIYSTDNIGHFGLASEYYTHFTSPIRRYPDLEVHRILKSIIKNGRNVRNVVNMEYVAEHSSKKELSAIKAEQEIEDRKKAEYMKKYIGKSFVGRITSIESYGLFVELENTVRGLVLFKQLKNYKENNSYRVNFFKENSLGLGDQVLAKVVSVNVDRGFVDFSLEGYETSEASFDYSGKTNGKNNNRDKNKKNNNRDKNRKNNNRDKNRKNNNRSRKRR